MEKFTLETRGHSSTEYNLICVSHTGYSFVNKEYEEVSVPGRDTPFIKDNYTKPRVEIDVEAFLESEKLLDSAILIKRWLTNDVQDLPIILSNMGDYFLKGFLANKLDIQEVIHQTGHITLKFNCQPFLYHKNGINPVTIVANSSFVTGQLSNPCTEGRPLIKISCSGSSVKFSVGTNIVHLKNVDGTYYLDSEKMEMYMYDNNYNVVLQNSKMYSDFPILDGGLQDIVVMQGTVTELQITPRWRL